MNPNRPSRSDERFPLSAPRHAQVAAANRGPAHHSPSLGADGGPNGQATPMLEHGHRHRSGSTSMGLPGSTPARPRTL
jgi:hypothetical protein